MTPADPLARALLAEVSRALRPLARAADGPLPDSLLTLATRAGVRPAGASPDAVRELAERVRSAWAPLEELAESGEPPAPQDVPELVEALGELVDVVREAGDVLDDPTGGAAGAGRRLLDLLVSEHLARERPLLHALLRLGGVLVRSDDDERLRLAPDAVPRLLAEPARTVHDAHRDADGSLDPYALLRDVRDVARGLGFPTSFQHPHEDELAAMGGDPFAELPDLELRVLLLLLGDDPPVAFGLALLPVTARPDGGDGDLAVAVLPFGATEVSRRRRLSAGWVVGATSSVDLATRQGVLLTADGADLVTFDEDDLPRTVRLGAVLESEGRPDEPALVVGSPDGARLEVGVLGVRLAAQVGPEPEVVVRFPLLGCRLVVDAAGDALLGDLLGARPLEARLDLVPTWSSRHGLSLEGGDGLSATRAVHGPPGPVQVRSATVEVAPDDDGLRVRATVAVRTRLGPVTLTVGGTGLDVAVSLPRDAAGTLGILDASLRPTEPDSVGVAVEAPQVSGGGVLAYDAEAGRWAGAVHLDVGGVAVAAVGLLTRDEEVGWSFLVAISADGFTPVQLGMGFTLHGVGGLVGVHREADVGVLRAGLGDGSLDAVLFPDDPLEDAVALLDGLAAAFPAAQGRHVVGPTALVGWGTPTLVTAELALAVELPDPVRLVAVGRLRARLPESGRPAVLLTLDALGVVDLEDRRVELDAVLRDSRVAGRAVRGAAALRARWGEDPAFVLAAGGHHPRFAPPPGLPQLDRLSVDLAGGDAEVRLDAYLALTTGTTQIGARVQLHVAVAGLTLDGHLGFDALLEHAPFGFAVDVGGAVTVRWRGRTLAGVQVELMLSGPAPLRARGEVELTLWRWSHAVAFDVTVGGSADAPAELAPADPLPGLLDALRDASAWSEVEPGRAPVELRRAGGRPGVVVVHPLAALEVRQRAVPLGLDVTRVGRRPVAGGVRRFTVTATLAGREVRDDETTTLRDHLAPARFLDLTVAERLSGPSFERLPVGVRLAAPGPTTADARLTAGARAGRRTRVLDPLDGAARDAGERAATTRRRRRDGAPAAPRDGRRRVRVRPPSYAVAFVADLGVDAALTPPAGWRTRTEATQALREELRRYPSRAARLQVVGWHETAGSGLPTRRPGETPPRPGEYLEVDPDGVLLRHPRKVTMEPGDTPLPPTRRPGLQWRWVGPPAPQEAVT